MNNKQFDTLRKNEITKALRYVMKRDGAEAHVTAWWTEPKTDTDELTGFQKVGLEILSEDYSERLNNVYLYICLWDRRKSFVIEGVEYYEPMHETTNTTNDNDIIIEEENTMTTNNKTMTKEQYHEMFATDRDKARETVIAWRDAVKALDEIQSNDRFADETPEHTVKAFVDRVGLDLARFVIASLVNRSAWDGRIGSSVAAWAETVDGSLDEEAAREASIYTTMHMAHLNQVAEAMMNYKPEEADEEENEMTNSTNNTRFEVGAKYSHAGLYGGWITKEVIARTEDTVTLRDWWIAEDSWEECHSDKDYAVEVETVAGVDVERVVIWTYKGENGYLYAMSDDELWELHKSAEEKERDIYEKVYNMLFDCVEDFERDYDKIMNAIADHLDLDEETFCRMYDEFKPEFDLYCEVVGPDEAEEENEEPTAEQIVEAVAEKVEQTKTRSAWSRGVKEYAEELVEELREAVDGGYVDASDLSNRRLFEKAMLNGAKDWKQYSEGGCSLCYDVQIAKRLCAPWELRKTDNGRRDPNPRELWIDVQSRALFQAARLILDAAF